MNQHQPIVAEFDRQFVALSEAMVILPASLAPSVHGHCATGEEDPHVR